MTKQALIYLRAAKPGKDGQALLNVQASACAAYADAFGYKIARVISEFGSGADLTRAGLSELFAAVAPRQGGDLTEGPDLPALSAVLVHDRERLGLSPAHRAIIETLLQKCGVRVVSVADAVALEDLNQPGGVQAAAESLGFRLAQLLASAAQNGGQAGMAAHAAEIP
jgi:DNA invertase Pin-like site-specific DNA recombinase